MPNPCRSYFAAAVSHRELPGKFLAAFGLPAQARQWVLGPDGAPRVFNGPLEAELAAMRVLLAKLNGARAPQAFSHRPVRSERMPEKKPSERLLSARARAEAVFKKGDT